MPDAGGRDATLYLKKKKKKLRAKEAELIKKEQDLEKKERELDAKEAELEQISNVGKQKRKRKEESQNQEPSEAESDAKEFLILMDNLVELHAYTKELKKSSLLYLKGFVHEEKKHLFGKLVHSRNLLNTIRQDMSLLLAELNNRSVFYASKIEHLDKIKKFMYAKEVHLIEDDPLKMEKLREHAGEHFMYVAN